MMQSIFTNHADGDITIGSFLICIGVSLILGILIAAVHMFRNTYTKSFVITLAILPTIVQIIIMLVNGNIGAGIAVMGAFSLVRFRSVPGTAKEIGSIFLAMAAGLATGMGYIGVAVVTVLILSGVSLLLEFVHFGAKKKEMLLRITIPESLDYTQVFDDVFQEYTDSWKLIQVKTTNMGSLFKLEYKVVLKEAQKEKEMLDSLRCRNGNLEILCSYADMNPEVQTL